MTVGILVFDGVDELDFVGPLDVFGAARKLGREEIEVITVGTKRIPLCGGNGLSFMASHDFSDAPPIDVLIVPGGFGAFDLVKDHIVLDWIAGVSRSARWTYSVCTGSFLLQAAGLTEGRRITTHSQAIEMLRSAGEGEVIEGERYVVDGNLVTAAGVSAGIDMSLWLVGQIYGEDQARSVKLGIEYTPVPPY
jgi:transcriptional regulator GlxA family with amidase domain